MTTPALDRYVRENRIALEVFASDGWHEFHGVSHRTLRAFARRGLVWWTERWTGGLTDRGREVLTRLEQEEAE